MVFPRSPTPKAPPFLPERDLWRAKMTKNTPPRSGIRGRESFADPTEPCVCLVTAASTRPRWPNPWRPRHRRGTGRIRSRAASGHVVIPSEACRDQTSQVTIRNGGQTAPILPGIVGPIFISCITVRTIQRHYRRKVREARTAVSPTSTERTGHIGVAAVILIFDLSRHVWSDG